MRWDAGHTCTGKLVKSLLQMILHMSRVWFFETGKGLVIFNSCSHGGIVNIVREVQMALGGQKVYAVVGGFHMMKLSGMDTLAIPEEEVVETAQELKGLGVEEIYTGHCTGNIAFGILKKELGEMVHALGTGETVVF